MAKGSVVKRSGSWYAVYRVDGHQKWEVAGRTKRTAERLLAHRMDEINSGDFQEIPKTTFREFAATWLVDYAEVNVKESTYSSYESIIRLHLNPYLGDLQLAEITAGTIQHLIAKKISLEHKSAKTALNFLVVLKEMLKHAVEWGYILSNPSTKVRRPRVEREEMDFLTPVEIRIFLNAVHLDYYTLFLTAILTGMRRGELLGLKWSDIDWYSDQICVRRALYHGKFSSPKSKRSVRRIMMSPTLRDALERHREFSPRSIFDLVFCLKNGNPVEADNFVKRQFHPALKKAGLRRIRFHDLRHTFASILLAQGENIKFVQSQLGHASATTTLDRYGHLLPDSHFEAANRLDQTVFGTRVVRKLLENPVSEGISPQNETPEVAQLQGLKLGSGEGI